MRGLSVEQLLHVAQDEAVFVGQLPDTRLTAFRRRRSSLVADREAQLRVAH